MMVGLVWDGVHYTDELVAAERDALHAMLGHRLHAKPCERFNDLEWALLCATARITGDSSVEDLADLEAISSAVLSEIAAEHPELIESAAAHLDAVRDEWEVQS